MSLKLKALFLLCAGIALSGCFNTMPVVSEPTAIVNPAVLEREMYSLNKYKSSEELRKVQVIIDASSISQKDLEVSYSGSSGRGTSYRTNYREYIELVDGKFQGEINVPVNERSFVSASTEDFTHKINGSKFIEKNENNVEIIFTAVNLKNKIKEEFQSKNQAEQRKIIQLVGMIGEALNSPNYLAPSVIARAETELELLEHDKVIVYNQYIYPFVSATLSDLKSGVNSSSGYMASFGAKYVAMASERYRLLKLATF